MTAKEMFEALGFELQEETNAYIVYVKNVEAIGYVVKFMYYINEADTRTYSCYCMGESGEIKPFSVTMELHKAISKQIEEMGW